MSFAEKYLVSRTLYPALIPDKPPQDLGIIVVIPACNEPELEKTIASLSCCEAPHVRVEVIVVINEPEDCLPEVSSQNQKNAFLMQERKKARPELFFDLYVLYPAPFPKKHAGVGLARKTGMDEAVRRFETLQKPEGIIVSLDADTLVERNYLTETERLFGSGNDFPGATIRFQHRIDELQDERLRRGIVLYEAYLHYYREALEFAGYPHPVYTIGSAFAVRAEAYVKQGGMNRRKAGEDFYFIHKLTQLGTLAELNSTCVYPSARVSNRVPFGTGAALLKWMKGESDLEQTYCFRAFADLRALFRQVPFLFGNEEITPGQLDLSVPLTRFLEEDDFTEALREVRTNCSGQLSFNKRFFQYFNAFKILKFLNFAHAGYYAFQNLQEAVAELKNAGAGYGDTPTCAGTA